MSIEDHWQAVYASKGEAGVSWYQNSPSPSLELIIETGAKPREQVIDIGGGASHLVDALLERGHNDLTVLDLSPAALNVSATRLGAVARDVQWIAGDVRKWNPPRKFAIWHDRAAFHFLISAEARAAYMRNLRTGLAMGGHAIIGTFALDGPEKCSGLPVRRYSPDTLQRELGGEFNLVRSIPHSHRTPWGSEQHFQFSVFHRIG